VFIWFQELRYQIGAFQWITKWSWPNVKMSITAGVYLTRGPSGPNPRPSGPRGLPAGQDLSRFSPGLSWHVSTLIHKKASESWRGGREVGRLTIHLLQTDLAKSVETPLCPYISPPMAKDSTRHSTCCPPHVKVQFNSSSTGEAQPRVESSIRSSSKSSLRDRWALVSLPFFIDFES
jgi:hypothetical protein